VPAYAEHQRELDGVVNFDLRFGADTLSLDGRFATPEGTYRAELDARRGPDRLRVDGTLQSDTRTFRFSFDAGASDSGGAVRGWVDRQ